MNDDRRREVIEAWGNGDDIQGLDRDLNWVDWTDKWELDLRSFDDWRVKPLPPTMVRIFMARDHHVGVMKWEPKTPEPACPLEDGQWIGPWQALPEKEVC
jgi:hypothetical protein